MESLSFKTIVATVRPPRIAVLVHTADPHWQSTCVRVIEFFSQVWGGHYNIIVPTDGKTVDPPFWGILRAFDPDYVYSYRLSGRDIKINEPAKFEALLERSMAGSQGGDRGFFEEALEEAQYTDFDISNELCGQIKRQLIPFFFEGGEIVTRFSSGAVPHFPITSTLDLLPSGSSDMPPVIEFFQRSTDRISDLWLASAFGALSSGYQNALSDARVLYRAADINDSNFGGTIVEAAEWDRISRLVPFWLCKQDVSFYRSVRFPSHEEPALVILGDALEDFCLSQCLARLRGGTVWFPSSLIEQSGYSRQLANLVMHLHRRAGNQRVAFWSLSTPRDGLEQVVTRVESSGLRGYAAVGYEPGRVLSYPRFGLARQASPKQLAGQFFGNTLVGFIETPKPIGFSHPTKHRWITDIEISGYLPPRHPDLAAQMVGVPGDTQDVRTSQRGWSYCCPHEGTYFGGELDEVLIRPTLKILEVPEILRRLGGSCELRFSPSEKGAFARDSIAKFGSLEHAARFLRDERHRRLLDKFLSKDKVPKGTFDEGDYVRGRRYLGLIAFETILGSRDGAATLIDDLLQKHVLHRGFIFKCTSCRNADWYSIAKVSDLFECSRCGSSQLYRRENWIRPEEPSWYYKLDELVYQGYSQGMVAPILTNDYLRANSSSFQFASEQEVFERDATEPSMEIDVCAVADGRLLIGEAKGSSSIENSAKERHKVIEKYRDLAQKLGVHRVVFSTLANEWTPGTASDLEQVFAGSTLELVSLTSKELL